MTDWYTVGYREYQSAKQGGFNMEGVFLNRTSNLDPADARDFEQGWIDAADEEDDAPF